MPTYDLVIYGATGFTGSLACQYLADSYPDLKWAVGGRSAAKLGQVKAQCGGKPGVVVADAADAAALLALAKSTKCVVACAGPFAQYGSKLVAACVEAGTDYCDITGEITWVREMIAVHDDAAAKSGARIVHLCGHDSVPWDLSVMMLAKALQKKGAELERVDFFDDIDSAPSGGTMATAMGIMFGSGGRKGPAQKALGYDSLLKEGGKASRSGVKAKNVGMTEIRAGGDGSCSHRTQFFMAGVNANAVKRSNALNHYGDNVVYTEGTVQPSWLAAAWTVFKLVCFGLCMYTPPVRWLMLQTGVIPSPGEGPSPEKMASGHLSVTGVAKGAGGAKATSHIHFSVDPGYKDTARMVVESGLALVLGDCPKKGGVFTPGCCQGEVLLQRLLATGPRTTFTVE